MITSEEKALKIAKLIDDKKGSNIKILELKDLTIIADYFVICSCESTTQVKALTEYVDEMMKKEGIRPLGIEGFNHAHWVLMDYNDVIVHIFLEEQRYYYDLERLWLDAPRIPLEKVEKEIIANKSPATYK